MICKRPLLYITIPGLALVLGLIWFRRKKIVHDTGGKTTSKSKDIVIEANMQDFKHNTTPSIPLHTEKNGSIETKLSKSAPIDIVRKRSGYLQLTDQQIDEDILNNEMQESLHSLNELDFELISPINLSDSVERKNLNFVFRRTVAEEKPIVVTTAMETKISPKHIFIENKSISEITVVSNDMTNQNIQNIDADDAECNKTPTRNPPVASPPLSLCSLQSNDSGKGSSPPHSEGAPATTYEFIIPQNLIGHLLGRKGSYVNQIKSKTGANVLIKKHPESNKIKICAVEGTQREIDAALIMIRQKLPEKRYPNLTLERVYFASPLQSITLLDSIDSSILQLQLIEGINNDVSVSSIISSGHLFFQQPLHPSFPSLNTLQRLMYHSYSLGDTPHLPELADGIICVACIDNSWYRVQIVSHDSETEMCVIKYLDYGGYVSVPATDLRQIRRDYMAVPFQAIECILSNLQPDSLHGYEWPKAATEALHSLTHCLVLQAQVSGYTPDGIPEVYLYACIAPNNVIFINKELVARKLVLWIDNE